MLTFWNVLLLVIIPLVRNEQCDEVGDVRRITNPMIANVAQICLQSGNMLNWSYICAEEDKWSPDNGHVWCREFRGALSSVGSVTNDIFNSGELKLSNVSCNRMEDANIAACNHTTTYNACKYLFDISCTFCVNNDSCNEPGFCDTEGKCDCKSNCLNGGFCDLGKCICRDQFYGDSCEMKRCDPLCVNNGTCLADSGTCTCTQSYYGNSCQFKMCPNQCSGNETCNNQMGTCECNPPYFGVACKSQNCTPACTTDGICNSSDGTCECNSIYYGESCQYLGTNCSNTCLNGGSCNYEDGICSCRGSFIGEQCENSQPPENILIYIGIGVCAILVVMAGMVIAILLCLLCLNRRTKNSPRSKDISTVEYVKSETINEIIPNGTNETKSHRKLKENKAYSKETKVSKCLNLNENMKVPSTIVPLPSNTDKGQEESYTQLGIVYNILDGGDEIYSVLLNGENPNENIYELYSRINESPLPSKNASIVLSQEERNSIHVERNEPIYETCIKKGVLRPKVEDLTDTKEYCEPPDNLPKIFDRMSYMKFREINPDTLNKYNPLGSGEFGIVYKGSWDTGNELIDVAIKTLKSSEEDMKTAFMREAAIMGQFNHPNILKLMGILSLSEPFMIVTELMKCDLPTLLINFKTSGIKLTMIPPVLLKFCREIASGMEHLASRNCVHRDLAARNVLLTKTMVCKIADFGMSREYKEEYDYYRCSGGLIPVKWTAPEAIFYKKYTEKSDVWAFGMTMYEIWTLGYKPWHDKSNEDILKNMQARQVLHPPTGCPKEIYDIMLETWNYNVEARVTFTQLQQLLEKPIVFQSKAGDLLGNDPSLFRKIY